MLEIGSLVDHKYKILGEIGHGGMSTVYMAINEKANKSWAIKEVRKDGVVDFVAVKQGLITETNMLKKLRHPNLPSIVDVIEDEESFLIVMDYIEGKSLEKVIQEHGAIPQKYVIAWAKQLCDTLLYLHNQIPPIIYRDMKPGNIILKPDGNLMLIDFGTAREFKKKNCGDTICLGTIGYAAPEQFGGLRESDARTDIYGLGATMYHLITGNNPSKSPYEIKPISQMNPGLSLGLERIIEKCTQRNPNERYQSAAELMYALEHYEEMADTYRKIQKKKLLCFIVTVIFSVLLVCGGVLCEYISLRNAENLYENLLDEAAKTMNYTEKLEIYRKCIGITGKGGEVEAYLGLMQTYKENDMAFTVEEANELTKHIKCNKKDLEKNIANYIEICFQMGKLYWYYFVDETGSENDVVRAKYSVEWFGDVLRYANIENANIGMAKVYVQIGTFYRDITMNVIEANDRGKYALLYKNLRILLNDIGLDSNESEIVRLKLLEFVRNAVWQYAAKFKMDGIKKEELMELLQMISRCVSSIDTSTYITDEKKQKIVLFLEDTQMTVESVFQESEDKNVS